MLLADRSRHTLTAGLCAATLGLLGALGGCGDSEPAADATAPPAAAEAPAVNPMDSANGAPATEAERGDPKRVGERPGDPALPAAKGDELEAAAKGSLLQLEGTEKKWRISATREGGAFCTTAATPGPADPPPTCSDETTTALNLDSADGGTQVSINAIRSTARGPLDQLLVWGIAQADMKQIRVRYGQHRGRAALSSGAITLKVQAATLKALGPEAKGVSSRVPVRTFAVSLPLDSGNPPTIAVAKPIKPTNGRVTLTLQ